MTLYRVPLLNSQQVFNVVLSGIEYSFLLKYSDAEEGGWYLSISTPDNVTLVSGFMLVTGCNLLQPYSYLGIGVDLVGTALFIYTDGDVFSPPTYADLGIESNMYYQVDDGA